MGGPSRSELAIVWSVNLVIDPTSILGEEGEQFEGCAGGFFEPPERWRGWVAWQNDVSRDLTCRPIRSAHSKPTTQFCAYALRLRTPTFSLLIELPLNSAFTHPFNVSNCSPRPRGGEQSRCVLLITLTCSPKSTNVYKTDDDQTQSTPNQPPQPSQGESSFGDSSGPLFSIYYKTAKEEDNKMAERWQKDADGILFFVSPSLAIRLDCGQTGTI